MSIRSRLASQPKKKLKLNSEQLFNATDLQPITFGVILPPKLRGKISTNSQNNPIILDENKNTKVHTFIIYERHKILKDKKNKWSTMARTFNTKFVTEIILKLTESLCGNLQEMPFDG